MTWSLETSNGNESAKIKWELLPYVRGRGLELGCGPWKAYPHMIGIDAQAYATSGGPNLCLDVADLELFGDACMDFVYSSHTLEDLEDTAATLTEWWRVIKPGGYLILYLPHKNFYPNIGQPGANPAHKHDFLPADIIAVMAAVAPDWSLLENQERGERDEYSFLQIYRKGEPGSGQHEPWQIQRPEKKAAVLRYGAYGDALWASSLFPQLKAQGYHITVYTQEQGEEVLRHDPHVDRIIVHSEYLTSGDQLVPFWMLERHKYDLWINLVHSVEARLLPAPHDIAFHWPDDLRRQLMDHNYLETVHQFAGLPYEPRQKFYPNAEESTWAEAKRAEFSGPVVVLNPQGSTWPKWWPYTERFAQLLAERRIHCVVIGDYRGEAPTLPATYGHFIGRDWSIRQAMAFAAQVDIVVGEESAIVNAVAFESPLKIVLLSHSTPRNLTRDWSNTLAVEPQGMPCYPCHRIHGDSNFCTLEKKTQSAGCQAVAVPQKIIELVDGYLDWREKEAA